MEIETAEGWRDLNNDESSTSLRSEMRSLPGLLGRMIRVRILGPDGEKKLEFNVPVKLLLNSLLAAWLDQGNGDELVYARVRLSGLAAALISM